MALSGCSPVIARAPPPCQTLRSCFTCTHARRKQKLQEDFAQWPPRKNNPRYLNRLSPRDHCAKHFGTMLLFCTMLFALRRPFWLGQQAAAPGKDHLATWV